MDRTRAPDGDGLKVAVTEESRASMRKVLQAIRRRTMLSRDVVTEASVAVYGDPRTLRRFAERVRDGKLGPFHSWVYFIERRLDGAIKIGTSTNPAGRLSELQVGCPERLGFLAIVPGDALLERLILEVFSPDRIRGEWFEPSRELWDFIMVLQRNKPKYPDG